MTEIRNDYTFDYFSKLLKYDETSPSCLIWIADRVQKGFKGLPAGVISKSGLTAYYIITVGKFEYLAHRIIMALNNNGVVSGMQVDHIDGNGLNNKIENLRIVLPRENSWNRGKQRQNKSGVNGVSIEAGKMYRAYFYNRDGKRCSKAFSFNKYGIDLALRLAIEWRLNQLELNGIALTERHGSVI